MAAGAGLEARDGCRADDRAAVRHQPACALARSVHDTVEVRAHDPRVLVVGQFGDVSCFSFYANKIITTGEGGMITTNNGPLADLAGPDGSSSEPPSSSDQVTDEVAASLDGGNAPPADVNSGPVIPKMLTNSPPPPPPPTDISALPSFGNASLWQ